MSAYRLQDFIDIAEFTLTGEEEYITIEVVPIEEISVEDFEEVISQKSDWFFTWSFLILSFVILDFCRLGISYR